MNVIECFEIKESFNLMHNRKFFCLRRSKLFSTLTVTREWVRAAVLLAVMDLKR